MKLTNFQQILLVIGIGTLIYLLFFMDKKSESSYSKRSMKEKFDTNGNVYNPDIVSKDVFSCKPSGCDCNCKTVGGKCPRECLVNPQGSVITGPNTPK